MNDVDEPIPRQEPGTGSGAPSADSRDQLHAVARCLLDLQRPVHTLRPEVLELAQILARAQTVPVARGVDIGSGRTRTAHGIALSPGMAAMCAEDYVRTVQFIRGTHAAIVDVRQRFPDRPVRVLYAGCGPQATLAVPLMAVFPPAEATFTLLDLHPESIESARNVIESLGLPLSVASYEVVDATCYCLPADWRPDLLLTETMRACLEAEPQVAITRHLLNQAPEAVLVPEEVRVDLMLVDVACEFDLRTGEGSRVPVQRNRVLVGTVFTLNRETVKGWGSSADVQFPGATVRVPDGVDSRYQPLLFTAIRVYGDHWLKDYDSGLTSPRQPTIEGAIKQGASIQFQYDLGDHPRLHGRVLACSTT